MLQHSHLLARELPRRHGCLSVPTYIAELAPDCKSPTHNPVAHIGFLVIHVFTQQTYYKANLV